MRGWLLRLWLLRLGVSLGAVCALVSPARAGTEAEEARARLAEVLARPEFRPLAEKHHLDLPHVDISGTWFERAIAAVREFLSSVLEVIGDGLGWLFKQLFGGLRGLFGGGAAGGGSTMSMVVTWAAVAAALGLIVYLLIRMMGSVRAERRAAGVLIAEASDLDPESDALARAPEDWRREAERLAAAGQRAEALRTLYLELLAGLHRARAIDYDRTRTNTAYVQDVPRSHAAYKPFNSLTRRFDLAVYGRRDPTERGVRHAVREVTAVRVAYGRERVRAT